MQYKILSVIAYDRSGTTFLGNLLNHYPNVFNIGEIDRGLKKIINKRSGNCSCGSSIQICEFWGKLDIKKEFKQYKENENIYNWVANETKANLLVDTSKSFNQIRTANQLKKKDHLILHLVRNPKGVVLSRMKTRKRKVLINRHPRPEIARYTNLLMLYDTLEWCYENIWFENFKKKKEKVLTVFYEDLVEDFDEKIIPFLEVEGKLETQYLKDKIPHVLVGNRNRFNKNRKIIIDQRWEEELNFFQKCIVDLISFPVRTYFRYKF